MEDVGTPIAGEQSRAAKGAPKETVYYPGYVDSKGRIYEAVILDGKEGFLSYSGDFCFSSCIVTENAVIKPRIKGVPFLPYVLETSWLEKIRPQLDGNLTKRLLNGLYLKYHQFVVADGEKLCILVTITMLSYCQELFYNVPYLNIYGDTGTGKSTIMTVLEKLCYRPLSTVSCPSADIFTYLGLFAPNSCPGTLIEDEAQGLDKDYEKLKIYKQGYKAGGVVVLIII